MLISWIVIYPVDSAIQRLNNRDLIPPPTQAKERIVNSQMLPTKSWVDWVSLRRYGVPLNGNSCFFCPWLWCYWTDYCKTCIKFTVLVWIRCSGLLHRVHVLAWFDLMLYTPWWYHTLTMKGMWWCADNPFTPRCHSNAWSSAPSCCRASFMCRLLDRCCYKIMWIKHLSHHIFNTLTT